MAKGFTMAQLKELLDIHEILLLNFYKQNRKLGIKNYKHARGK